MELVSPTLRRVASVALRRQTVGPNGHAEAAGGSRGCQSSRPLTVLSKGEVPYQEINSRLFRRPHPGGSDYFSIPLLSSQGVLLGDPLCSLGKP
jgi:hypothetical protein